MRKSVWKWVLTENDLSTVAMPVGAEILSVHEQMGNVCLWALVDLDEDRRRERTFRIAGTGHVIANCKKLDYIGSVHFMGGSLVFHVFEVRP